MTIPTREEGSVRARRLSKTYQPLPPWMRLLIRTNIDHDITALDGVDLEVGPGEICAIVGPNGAGKTTAFRILVGLTTPTSGTATVMGLDCEHQSVAVRRVIGWMPAEDRSLLLRLSATQNLLFHGRLQGMRGPELRRKIHEVLALVGLGDAASDSVVSLSAGMRSRLQLARALLHDPRVLILDEPTGAVDPVAAHDLLRMLTAIVEERRLAALVSSHRLEEIEALASHIVLLDKGRVRFDGDLDVLRRQWGRAQLMITFGSEDAARAAEALIGSRGLGDVHVVDGTSLRCALRAGVEAGAVLQALGPHIGDVSHVHEVRTPLRDVLAEIYRSDPRTGGDPAT